MRDTRNNREWVREMIVNEYTLFPGLKVTPEPFPQTSSDAKSPQFDQELMVGITVECF